MTAVHSDSKPRTLAIYHLTCRAGMLKDGPCPTPSPRLPERRDFLQSCQALHKEYCACARKLRSLQLYLAPSHNGVGADCKTDFLYWGVTN